ARGRGANDGDQPAEFALDSTISDSDGKAAAHAESAKVTVEPGKTREVVQTARLADAKLWSVEAPALYRLVTVVRKGDAAADLVETTFGVRTIEFTKDNGFLLNGKRVPIRGVCLHHDLGCLGAAVNRRAIERQLGVMRA